MRISISQFDKQLHLSQVATLLAHRHHQERQQLSFLPAMFENDSAAQQAIEATLQRSNSTAYVATDGERVNGFIIGYESVDFLRGRSGWVSLAGHGTNDVELYHELYAALASHWVKRGIFDHYIIVSAANTMALQKWFSLSFGQQQAYSLLSLKDLAESRPPSIPSKGGEVSSPTNIVIRQANEDDVSIAHQIYDTNIRFQLGSPTFAPTPPESLKDTKNGYVEALTDEESTFWLAFVEDQIAGYQIYYPAENDDPNLMLPNNTIEFPAGASLPGKRGLGVGTALTRHALKHAKDQGYGYCLTDWRTTNPLSSRFWVKMGFTPIAYRLTRHIDERIAWAGNM